MNLKKLIKETVHLELNRIIENLQQFSFDDLMDCSDIDHAKEYLERHLERAGEGDFRITYGLDDHRVIKLTKKEIGQNSQEIRNSRCLTAKYAAQVLDKHPELWWVVSERVERISLSEFIAQFEDRIGSPIPYTPDGHSYGLYQKHGVITTAIEVATDPQAYRAMKKTIELNSKWISESEWYAGLIAVLRKCQVQADDFHFKNWGIRPSTGELVILDLGF